MRSLSRFPFSRPASLLLLLGSPALVSCSTPRSRWAEATSPYPGEARAIGTTSAGCAVGTVSLPPDGPGYQMMRTSRRRYYGHPELVKFIVNLGAAAARKKAGPLLVGDLGQPRGGPSLTGHRSHQNGLD